MNQSKLYDAIYSLGGRIYQVGGCVRDSLLNRKSNDIDYVVQGVSQDGLTELFGETVGHSFPVFLACVDNETREIAMARKEKSTGPGYNDFECEVNGISLEEDLYRRDLTINAMAFDGTKIIDPFDGQSDLSNKILRHVSGAFKEDPLRVYRIGRFASQLGFGVAQETKDLCAGMKEDLKALPGDRLVKELDKVLMSPYPSKFFDFLAEIGCLGIHFEEIEALDVPDKHDGTAYRHTMNLLDRAKGRFPLKIMYGLLTHDLGKGVTPSQDHPCHYNHDKLGVTLVKDMADRLRFTAEHKRFGMDSSRYHLVLRKLPEMKPGKALKYLFIRDVEDLMLVAYLDAIYRDGANTMIETPIYNEMKKLFLVSQRVAQEITGKDLIAEGIEPGPKLGDILFMRRTELFKKLRIDPRV